MTGATVDELLEVIGNGLPDGEESGLRESEKAMIRALYEGSRATLGVERVRATVLRRLCMHSDMVRGGQPGRFWIRGGSIEGSPPVAGGPDNLDLAGLHLDFGLRFKNVQLPRLALADTRLLSLELVGGSAAGIKADRLEIDHDLVMTRGFTCNGATWLRSARVGGDLNCGGAQFEAGPDQPSINLDGARIGGRLYLRRLGKREFHASHGVFGRNSRIAGGVLCTKGRFDRELDFTRAQVQGDFSLRDAWVGGLASESEENPDAVLELGNMHVSGRLSLWGTKYPGPKIVLVRTRVDGSFTWAVERPESATGDFEVNLRQARVSYFRDSLDHWHGAKLSLEGFSFDGMSVERDESEVEDDELQPEQDEPQEEEEDLAQEEQDEPLEEDDEPMEEHEEEEEEPQAEGFRPPIGDLQDEVEKPRTKPIWNWFRSQRSNDQWLEARKSWLEQQEHWSPEPYDQTRAALQKAGHESRARAIAVERERMRQTEGGLNKPGKVAHRLYGVLLGYGYKPFQFFVACLVLVVLCWVAYTGLGPLRGLKTCDRTQAIASAEQVAKANGAGTAKEPADCGQFAFPEIDAPGYHSFLFALDAFVPVDLGQESAWHPRPNGYIYLVTAEIALGWLFAGLLLGAVTGVLRRD